MQKIPTMFERDWAKDRSRVIDVIHPGCEWVAAGEGIATRKIDGTSCLIWDGKLFKRREVREGESDPPDFELCAHDEETGKRIGWITVGDGPEDKWHRQAFDAYSRWDNGTYELVGPKIQGNPEGFTEHVLISHGSTGQYPDCPRTFDKLRGWFADKDIEGIVFHHPDGRMAKLKKRDLGLKRK